MKDINLINYLNKHNIDVPEYMSVSTVSLPSLVNKSEEIKHIKNENQVFFISHAFRNTLC